MTHRNPPSGIIRFQFDGQPVTAQPGQSVAAALWTLDERVLRTTRVDGAPRGLFCGMGVCFDCLVTIDGRANRQACLVPATEGMVVTRQHGNGSGSSER